MTPERKKELAQTFVIFLLFGIAAAWFFTSCDCGSISVIMR